MGRGHPGPDADLTFALFYDPEYFYDPNEDEDPDEDPDLHDFPQYTPSDRWQADLSSTRQQFDFAWRSQLDVVSQLCGQPNAVGRLDSREDEESGNYAVWRIESRLLVLAQTDDFLTYSLYDRAALHLVEYGSDRGIPDHVELYDLLTGGEEEK